MREGPIARSSAILHTGRGRGGWNRPRCETSARTIFCQDFPGGGGGGVHWQGAEVPPPARPAYAQPLCL